MKDFSASDASANRKSRALRKRLLRDDEIKAFTGYMRKFMGPTFTALSDEFGLSIEDTLRFQSLAFRLAEAREAKGFTLKEASSRLKVAKYKLDYVEESSIRNIDPVILCRYVEFLDLKKWFGRWKKTNAELAMRMGLVSASVPVKENGWANTR